MSRVLTLQQLADEPEPEYLLKPFIIDGGLTVLFGPSGVFKSFLALDWALRVAVAQSSLYIAAEGAGSLRRRVDAWRENGPRGDVKAAVIASAVNLMDRRDVDQLIADVLEQDWTPALFVFDTLARCMPGGDENSAQDMGKAIGSVDRLRSEFKCAAVLVHHTGKSDGENERGSSALRGAADISVRAKAAGKMQVRLECAKVRDAAEFDPLVVRMLQVNGSLVAASAAPRPQVLEQAVREFLRDHPGASSKAVEEGVTGRASDIRAVYRRVVPVVPPTDDPPEAPRPTPPSLKGRGDEPVNPTLDPDEHMRMRLLQDGGF